MTCNQHQHSIHAYEFMILFHLKLALSESVHAPISFHIWHLSIYGINLWFFETFREGPWCLFHYNLSGPWAIIIHQWEMFQPLTSMIHWKTPGLYIDVILFSWRDAGWDFPLNEQFRGRRCGALAFFWIDGSPHERIDQILKQGSLDGTQFGWIKLEQQMLLVIFEGFPERSLCIVWVGVL